MTVGGQSSSAERKEYFSALALDQVPGLQHAVGARLRGPVTTRVTVSVSSWSPASSGNLYSALLFSFYVSFFLNPPTRCLFKAGSFPALTQDICILRQKQICRCLVGKESGCFPSSLLGPGHYGSWTYHSLSPWKSYWASRWTPTESNYPPYFWP